MFCDGWVSSSLESSDVVSSWIRGLRRSVNIGVLLSLAFLILFEAASVIVCRRSSKSWSIVCLSVAGSMICIVCNWSLGTGNLGCSQGSLMFCIGAGHPPNLK